MEVRSDVPREVVGGDRPEAGEELEAGHGEPEGVGLVERLQCNRDMEAPT